MEAVLQAARHAAGCVVPGTEDGVAAQLLLHLPPLVSGTKAKTTLMFRCVSNIVSNTENSGMLKKGIMLKQLLS